MTERIEARYWIETAFPLEDAAAIMAGEQSTGTFVRVPGETDELRERYAARVERIVELGTVDRRRSRGSGLPKEAARARRAAHRRGHAYPGPSRTWARRCPTCSRRSRAIFSS